MPHHTAEFDLIICQLLRMLSYLMKTDLFLSIGLLIDIIICFTNKQTGANNFLIVIVNHNIFSIKKTFT